MRCTAFFIALTLLVACSDGGSPDDASVEDSDATATPDATASPDASGPSVEVGTGSDHFQPLTENELIPFIQGPQGGGRFEGYHIWGGIKMKGFDEKDATIKLRYSKADTGEEIASQERILPLQPAGDGYFVAWGFSPRLHDCCAVLATHLIMRAEITDRDGLTGFDERTVVTPDQCIDILSGQSVCP